MASAQTETDFEKPPVLKATDLVSANLLKGAGAVTRDALGYEQERRELAKKLGVDPYTSNPILAKKLDEIAWVSFTAHLGVSAAMSVAVPGSMIITGVRTVDNLVWDTLRGDLIVRIETKLEELDDTTRQEGVHGQRLEHT